MQWWPIEWEDTGAHSKWLIDRRSMDTALTIEPRRQLRDPKYWADFTRNVQSNIRVNDDGDSLQVHENNTLL
jgi:hypothetical protein